MFPIGREHLFGSRQVSSMTTWSSIVRTFRFRQIQNYMSAPLTVPANRHAIRLLIASFVMGCIVCVMFGQFTSGRAGHGTIHAKTNATIDSVDLDFGATAVQHQKNKKHISSNGIRQLHRSSRYSDADVDLFESFCPSSTLVSLNIRLQI